MALVLETLGSDKTLDLGGLGVWLLALALWLNLTADNELADLYTKGKSKLSALHLVWSKTGPHSAILSTCSPLLNALHRGTNQRGNCREKSRR